MDKRKERRVTVNWPLQLSNQSGGAIRSRIVDISTTGIQFVSTQSYAKGDMLGMEIVIRPACVIRCVGRVVREATRTARYVIYGAEFVYFSGDGKQLLQSTLTEVVNRIPEASAAKKSSSESLNIPDPEPSTRLPESKPTTAGSDSWGFRAMEARDDSRTR